MSTDSLGEGDGRSSPGSSPEMPIDKLVEVISRSQQNYRELIDNLDQAVFTLSIDGEVRVANRRLAEIIGVPFQDLVGHNLTEFVESPTLDEALQSLLAFAQKGTWSGIVPVKLRKDPASRYFHCWLQAAVEDGRLTDVIGWARDVTEQHESEMRFTQFVESLSAGVFFSTVDGKLLDANPALIRMWGFDSKEEVQKYNIRERYADPAQRQQLIRDTTAEGSVQDRQINYRRKDGSVMLGRASALAIRDHSGRVVRFQGTIVNITKQVEIEKQLHREQEFSRRLIDCFPDLIAVVDTEGNFTFASERAKEVLGIPGGDHVGRRMGGRTHPDDQEALAATIADIVSGRKPSAQLEYRVRHANGSWKTLRGSFGPLFDEAGKITGVVASARDVTESILVEQHLAQREKLAAMGQMMTGAAHELNNPLTAILGVSDLLREHAADEPTRRRADLILQQARRAAGIVQDLLVFSRPAALGNTRIGVAEMVDRALLSQRTALAERNIRVKCETSPGLPPVEGDARLLAQVFTNLIANAEQSIAAARGSGTIEISLSRQGNHVCVTLSDDGAGIAAENMGRIFDPFFTTKRPGGGSGLGLTICLAVVKEHGGRIEVESTPGRGATFHVLLPVAPGTPVTAPGDTGASPKAGVVSGGNPLEGRTVLIVDDEEGIREIVQEGLNARGVKAAAVESSEAALAQLKSNAYDAIICDFNLPGMSGMEFLEKVRAQRGSSPPPFVFMTGEMLDSEAFDRFRKDGMRLLQKPFHLSALAELLAELLQAQPSPAR
ncbi:MAG: PAS domain S-box protein [Candidatus Acidiferrales bacterium]